MKYIAALYANGKVVTGGHHGDAFTKLTLEDQQGEITSGFIDSETGKFISDEIEFYAKNIILIRHAHACDYFDPGISGLGYSQCERVVHFLRETQNVQEYQGFASCCNRTRETAEFIFGRLGIHYEVRPDFCDQRNWDLPCWRAASQWFESPYSFVERLRYILNTLPANSIIISHCNFVANMAQLASNTEDITELPEWSGSIPHCSVTCVINNKLLCIGKII